ncbi:hypothetical protein ACU5EH_00600 [Aliivibrio salmonicida]|uniref:hypothetical protein n=1 Tax=Aliivibrio salmonicida TaxID=40269 RepID=UPI00406C406D
MIVTIDGCNFNVESISTLSRNKNVGVYFVQGFDEHLANFATNTIENKVYFDIEVLDQGRSMLIGGPCSFDCLNVFNKTLRLIVNWVDLSLFE